MFKDRSEAGKKLAGVLSRWSFAKGIVMAIPRGGVVVGAEVANTLDIDLDLIIPRKIGAPHNPEVAVGAVTQDGTAIFDDVLLARLGLERKDLAETVACEIKEIKRRMKAYRKSADFPDLGGKPVIVVDDGVATGCTMLAALRSVRKYNPLAVTLAVPVAPRETLTVLRREADRTVCLHSPEVFYAVGQFYADFEQTGDEEVVRLLKKAGQKRDKPPGREHLNAAYENTGV
ncbi:MAG: phosphoribosyltransferase [Firmicutes bacterium]|nr:phosphoribosyltransferase [Bacillota bacterium]